MSTIQFISNLINQLDLAIDQLSLNDVNHDRFALILVDNAIELTLHNYAVSCSSNTMLKLLGKKDEYEDLIKQALGWNFDLKAKLAYEKGIISQEYYETILILHSYRNKSYHLGLKDEKIIHSLAIFYLITVCEILRDYKSNGISASSTDTLSIRAAKYIGKIDCMRNNFDLYNSCFTRVLDVAENLKFNLKEDLYSSMEDIINENDSHINYLLDNPDNKDRDRVIIDCQCAEIAFTEKAKKFAKEKGFESNYTAEYLNWIISNYPFEVKKDPIPNWTKRLNSLKDTTGNHKILKKYHDFILQTQDLRDKILKSVESYDNYINMAIDMARGK